MIKRFIKYYRPHRGLFILDMVVAFLAAILSVFTPMLTRTLLKVHIPNKDIKGIIFFLALMAGIMIFKSIFTYIRIRWGHVMGVRMESDMREDIFGHLQKLSFTYFDNTKTGHIMSRISNDLNMIAEVAHHAPEDLIISLFMIVGSFIAMFYYDSTLASIALIPVPLLIIWGLTFGHRMRGGFRLVRKRIADINSTVENSVQGIREVKSFTNENLEMEKFGTINFTFQRAKEKMYKIMSIYFSGMTFLTDFYYLVVIGGGVYLIFHGKIDIVDLLAFTLYVNFILRPIQRLVQFTEQFQQGSAAFERFIEIMDIEPDIRDKKNAKALKNVAGKIEIEDLTFRYNSSEDWVLQDINLTVPAGKTIALVGESGAGKSTIASLIPRFYEAQKGCICIDGNNIMDLTQKSLRDNIALVQQNVFLFDTTIRENIIYGNPEATDEQVVDAARKANILDFIETLPDGFETLTGERGVKLSGGQKQRISIARAFLKNPPILIFDEATSSLDTESEAYIQTAMEELSQNRTTIIIAHRLSTVRKADLLYVINKGRIVEQGTHDELMERKDYYYKLYTKNMIF
ncbi:MAG: ABC transporter ATP-binding protein/permease [Candidatus Cloacimonetes bacterium]|nr:ABC transporter ATP-binding protein/permease [Candidatus Cloacimonadota bacterium]MCF7869125.1 ABC transporter ATP-binding protein/permease [Candidatus Cloacimonadota bacterium]MCF7884539.1 ABC transporter ATP-binding protein/permease [Candidatus Cloacimonadota bacterium]